MNLDLLKKLVKLANNNPNEHEANSAARRACKLIENAEFKFVADVKPNPIFNPSPAQEDFIRNTQRPVNNYYTPDAWSWVDDYIRNASQRREKAREKAQENKANLKCSTCGKDLDPFYIAFDLNVEIESAPGVKQTKTLFFCSRKCRGEYVGYRKTP